MTKAQSTRMKDLAYEHMQKHKHDPHNWIFAAGYEAGLVDANAALRALIDELLETLLEATGDISLVEEQKRRYGR